MLSAMPVGINPQHRDPMLDKAMTPSPQVLPTINYLAGCSAWDDDVWLVHIVSLVGSGDFFDPLSLDAMVLPSPEGCSSSFDMHFLARLIPSLEELLGFKVERMMGPSASLTLWLRRLSKGGEGWWAMKHTSGKEEKGMQHSNAVVTCGCWRFFVSCQR